MNIPPSEELAVHISANDERARDLFRNMLPYIQRLARFSDPQLGINLPAAEASGNGLDRFGEDLYASR
ncbi:MAG: hypothetical protein MPW15_09415 [Candidatus Manganitrophus sp.]|nr:hypothetical protein [Candidatus Manganitrophus sp.]